MAIDYTYIRSRQDFYPLLDTLIDETQKLLGETGGNWRPLVSIAKQLQMINDSTFAGRNPTKEERLSVNIGLLVSREFEPSPNLTMESYINRLAELSDYFQRWLSDEQMASFDENDWRNYFPEDFIQ